MRRVERLAIGSNAQPHGPPGFGCRGDRAMTWKAQTSQRTKRPCHEAAKARGWRVAGDFTDEGSSGAVADLTRLSRSTDLAPLLERLKFRSVPARVEPLNVGQGPGQRQAHAARAAFERVDGCGLPGHRGRGLGGGSRLC